jgi:hypothetical protein
MAGRLSPEKAVATLPMPAKQTQYTNMIAAAHFMSRGLIKLGKHDKKIFALR